MCVGGWGRGVYFNVKQLAGHSRGCIGFAFLKISLHLTSSCLIDWLNLCIGLAVIIFCTNFQDKAATRKGLLDDSLQVHQYLADVDEAEGWLQEKEPIVTSDDYGKDEDSAQVSNG